jgi:hypothetical protein
MKFINMEKIMDISYQTYPKLLLVGVLVLAVSACSSMKTPATAQVAVSNAALDNAASSGAPELAAAEMGSAREKMARANQAMAAKDYTLANDLATQAQLDAKLAQAKANSAKAQSAANALQEDIRILREELARANKASAQ